MFSSCLSPTKKRGLDDYGHEWDNNVETSLPMSPRRSSSNQLQSPPHVIASPWYESGEFGKKTSRETIVRRNRKKIDDSPTCGSQWRYQDFDENACLSPQHLQPPASPPPPIPPRRHVSTQTSINSGPVDLSTLLTKPVTVCQSTVTQTNKSVDLDTLSTNIPKDVVINKAVDRSVCTHGAYIERVVKTQADVQIDAKCGRLVSTQIVYPSQVVDCECGRNSLNTGRSTYVCMCRPVEIYSRVTTLDKHWLSDVSRTVIIIKEGVVSTGFVGRLHLYVFNNTTNSVKLMSGTPVAIHQTKLFEYT